MSECPSCGRFAGPYPACPYCGARLKGRPPLRWLKVAALALAAAGLSSLWFAATRVRTSTVPIGQVSGMMNMAYIRIEGRVSRGPDYDPRAGSLAFWVADDSGELRVSAYRNEARDLITRGKIPSVGDQVAVAGTLRIREDFTALYLNAADQLEITRPAPVPRQIAAITPLDLGLRVRVQGQVREVFSPYQGLTLITLRDQSGEIALAVSQGLISLTAPLPPIEAGQTLVVTAAVSLYKDTPQLVPASGADIVHSASAMDLIERAVASLSPVDVGTWVRVQGEVVETNAFATGVRFALHDGSGPVTLTLLLWEDLYLRVPNSDTLDIGARVQVQGEIAEYRGRLEIVPEEPLDVVVLVAAPAPDDARAGELGPADAGRLVRLTGVLGEAQPFSSGVRYHLDDGTGKVTVLLWSSVAERAPTGLTPGARLRVTGTVRGYRDTLEIVPRWGRDLQVLE